MRWHRWSAEREAGPFANAEVNAAYDLSGATYDYYFSHFGRDSINGSGLTLKSTVRHCPTGEACPYANAFWDGNQCTATPTPVQTTSSPTSSPTASPSTSRTSVGAINESLSDVFGELLDLEHPSTNPDTAANRLLMGEDLAIVLIVNMENPPTFGDPARMVSPLFHAASAQRRRAHQQRREQQSRVPPDDAAPSTARRRPRSAPPRSVAFTTRPR